MLRSASVIGSAAMTIAPKCDLKAAAIVPACADDAQPNVNNMSYYSVAGWTVLGASDARMGVSRAR